MGCAMPPLSYALGATMVSGIAVSGVAALPVWRSSGLPHAHIRIPGEVDSCTRHGNSVFAVVANWASLLYRK